MFLNATIFKKLINNAYKGTGLHVHNKNGDIILWGSSWIILFVNGKMPKEIKGEIIKLIGDFPLKGEAFRVNKDGEHMAIDVSDETVFELDVDNTYKITNLSVETSEGKCNIIENNITDEKYLINAMYTDIVDLDRLGENDEFPEGPYTPVNRDYALIWQNSELRYMAFIKDCSSNKKISEMLSALKGVDCNIRI